MAFKERLSRMESGQFDVVLAGWGADYQDAMTFLDLLESNNGNNHGKYSNTEYDKCIRLAKSTSNKEERYAAMKKAEEIIASDVPIALLFQAKKNYIVNEKLSNFTFSAVGPDFFMNYADIK